MNGTNGAYSATARLTSEQGWTYTYRVEVLDANGNVMAQTGNLALNF